MENTNNLKLPLLIPNQSGKEITHNEALIILDNLIHNGVIDKDLTVPPENPAMNDLYIVAPGATGVWSGKDRQIAYFDNGWRFSEAKKGTFYWVNDESCIYVFNGISWSKYSSGEGSSGGSGVSNFSELEDVLLISLSSGDIVKFNGSSFVNSKSIQGLTELGVNCNADANNKLSVKSDYVLFDKATNSSRVKVNKASTTDTASHLFQTNYSGRAEFGLINNDDFTLKVSSDGENWNNAFVVDRATGNVDFKGTITNNGNVINNGNNASEDMQIITLNGETEVEFTNLNDGYQHKFEFISLKPSEYSYMLAILGNSSEYINTGYSYSLFYMDDLSTANWNTNSDLGHNVSAIKITLNKYSAWQLNPNSLAYANFTILSDLTQNGPKYFDAKSIVADSTIPPYMIMGTQSGMLISEAEIDRIKFYLSSGNFASGTIKHYIVK